MTMWKGISMKTIAKKVAGVLHGTCYETEPHVQWEIKVPGVGTVDVYRTATGKIAVHNRTSSLEIEQKLDNYCGTEFSRECKDISRYITCTRVSLMSAWLDGGYPIDYNSG